MSAHLLQNTDKDYQCVTCGSKNVSVIRQDKKDPRLKCNACNFMFNASDSAAAQEAGAIQISSPESLAGAEDPEIIKYKSEEKPEYKQSPTYYPPISNAPRSPSYVLLSKERGRIEFATKRDVKAVVLRWEAAGVKYDCFELTPKKFDVKLDIS